MKTKEMTKEIIAAANMTDEALNRWFASLPPEQQQFALELWKMIEQADDDHVIEIQSSGQRLRATLIYLLRPRSRRRSSPAGCAPRGRPGLFRAARWPA
jgi:hypothetical protein